MWRTLLCPRFYIKAYLDWLKEIFVVLLSDSHHLSLLEILSPAWLLSSLVLNYGHWLSCYVPRWHLEDIQGWRLITSVLIDGCDLNDVCSFSCLIVLLDCNMCHLSSWCEWFAKPLRVVCFIFSLAYWQRLEQHLVYFKVYIMSEYED